MHKYAKPLTGYLEPSDFKKLDRVRDLVFKYEENGKKLFNQNGLEIENDFQISP